MIAFSKRLISRWLIGLFFGTLIIAVTSPWFVRSYVPLTMDPVRKTWTLPEDAVYRWRSEGYANTHIGPHGMPGRTRLADGPSVRRRIALWGDSQAEGVAVDDSNKLFAAIERAIDPHGSVAVYPLARSGEDAAVWIEQIPRTEASLGIDAHVILMVDWEDLAVLQQHDTTSPDIGRNNTETDGTAPASKNAWAALLPAFVIQAARHVLTQDDGANIRRWRWTVGPVAKGDVPGHFPTVASENERVDWQKAMQALAESTNRPVLIVHAPRRPEIVNGRVVRSLDHPDHIRLLRAAASDTRLHWLDVTNDLIDAADSGDWPHGFHNGQIGVGHLNAHGYQLIAQRIAQHVALTQDVIATPER
ncbi:hypothetical protein [Crateriforma conspicua]|uniref:Uncharacterized protein n=1 Tax=Crateriforma conspicua TaxID=2527996 RepID=A0A5C5XSC6_9PLAN|nr:hypothetical protein [Crateriforma conspicua]QDV60969.1 hypothetical protein Mal65_00900 [Crateriforma conspicua]TWT65804.1 hypothetical protein Pan14r_53540 [Crateriforma conspicua]